VRNNAEVKLELKKSSNKEYFDKKLNAFTKLVKKSGILEDLKWKKCAHKPSMLKKLKKKNAHLKWKFY
jgi:ribosomal protein S21